MTNINENVMNMIHVLCSDIVISFISKALFYDWLTYFLLIACILSIHFALYLWNVFWYVHSDCAIKSAFGSFICSMQLYKIRPIRIPFRNYSTDSIFFLSCHNTCSKYLARCYWCSSVAKVFLFFFYFSSFPKTKIILSFVLE